MAPFRWSRQYLIVLRCYQASRTRTGSACFGFQCAHPPAWSSTSLGWLRFCRQIYTIMPPKQATLGYVESSQRTLQCIPFYTLLAYNTKSLHVAVNSLVIPMDPAPNPSSLRLPLTTPARRKLKTTLTARFPDPSIKQQPWVTTAIDQQIVQQHPVRTGLPM